MSKIRLLVSCKELFYSASLFIIISSVILRIERFAFVNFLLAMVSMILIVIVTVKNLRTIKTLLPFLLAEIGVYLYIIINTLRFNYVDSLFPLLMMFLKGIAVVAIFAAYKNNGEKVYRMLSDVFLILIMLNLIQITLFPDLIGNNGGMRSYLISSNYNQFGGIFMPGIMVSYIASSIDKHNVWRFLFIILLSIMSVAIVGSVTSSACFLMIAIFSIHLLFLLMTLFLIIVL